MFIRTARLLLRPGWAEDAPALFRAIADEAIVRQLASAPWPYALADAETCLATVRGPRAPSLLIFRRAARAPELVGTIGFGSRSGGATELGYWIARAHWNQGYATEAGIAVIAAARSLRVARLAAGHFLDNPASGRVLEKLGFTPTGATAARYSAGRGEEATSRLYELEVGEARHARMAA